MEGRARSTTGCVVTVNNTTKGWSYSFTSGQTQGTTVIDPTGTDPSADANETANPPVAGQVPPTPDLLIITIQLPYSSVAWEALQWFGIKTMNAQVEWYSCRNVPLTVSTTLPQNPIGLSGP